MKKLLAMTMCLIMAAGVLAGCGGDSKETTAAATTAANAATTAADGSDAAGGTSGEVTGGMCEMPIILTSVGQSADVNVVETLFKKAEVEVTLNNTITADELSGYKTLVLAIGGSSKGLGAAGIDENQELERVNALITEAKNQGMKILSMHIGGSQRRGTLSDKFIPDAISAANAAIILAEGDSDNMMKDLLNAGNIPSVYITTQVEAIEPIQLIFGK